jgi:hypothetical protein
MCVYVYILEAKGKLSHSNRISQGTSIPFSLVFLDSSLAVEEVGGSDDLRGFPKETPLLWGCLSIRSGRVLGLQAQMSQYETNPHNCSKKTFANNVVVWALTRQILPILDWAMGLWPISEAFSRKKKYSLSSFFSALSGMRCALMNIGSENREKE